MIPKKIFSLASFDSFERFFLLFSLKKKTLCLIFNIFYNDLLDKDRDILSITTSIKNNNKQDDMEVENSKTLIDFLTNLLNTLITFYLELQKIEIYLTTLTAEEFKESKTASFWNYISAAYSNINGLINMIKDDNFSIKYQFESLKNMSLTITEEFSKFKVNLKNFIKRRYSKSSREQLENEDESIN